MQALCDELTAGDVPVSLAQPFTLTLVWHDLRRLAGETPPQVAVLMSAPTRGGDCARLPSQAIAGRGTNDNRDHAERGIATAARRVPRRAHFAFLAVQEIARDATS